MNFFIIPILLTLFLLVLSESNSNKCIDGLEDLYQMSNSEQGRPVLFTGNTSEFKYYRITDEVTGNLTVSANWTVDKNIFDYRRKIITLEYVLTVSDTTDNTICQNETNFYKHSIRKILFSVEELFNLCAERSECTIIFPANFNYVFTGCYKVNIFPIHSTESYSLPQQMLYTKYKKYTLINMNVAVSPHHYPRNDFTAVFNLNYETPNRQKRSIINTTLLEALIPAVIEIKIRNVDNYSNKTNCLLFHDNKEHSKHEQCDKCKLEVNKYNKEDYLVTCTLHNTIPGNYCVMIRFDDDRCRKKQTIWAKDYNFPPNKILCSWSMITWIGNNITDPEILPVEDNRVNTVFYSNYALIPTIIILTTVSITIIIMIYLRINLQINAPPKPPSEHPNILVLREEKNVLLLYPRDCPEFMEAMRMLRNILRKANCKVFDCFDNSLYNKIVENSNAWMTSNIGRKSMQVIIMVNDCSKLVEMVLNTGKKISYKEPECFDNLFLVGLACLQSISINTATKLHVVSLQKNYKDEQELRSLPATYASPTLCLPFHLSKLVLSLHNTYDSTIFPGLEDWEEVHQFQTLVNKYQNFLRENQNYLDNLFNMSC